MTFKHSKFASTAAIAAAISLGATPAAAVKLPMPSGNAAQIETGAAAEQNHHHRWRRYDRRHRNRVDAGDVIAGVLVLGTIAAVAGVFDGDDDRRDRNRERERYRDRDYDNRDYRGDRYESGGIERAADMCVEQVERGRDRVSDVRDASRRSDGWHVSGTLEAGGNWNCWIDNDGRIRNIDFGASNYPVGDYSAGDQWDDGAYARARANTRTPGDGAYTYRSADASDAQTSAPQPDYPGGPLPGEEGYGNAPDSGEIDADLD
ncbi:hypothetical protein [Aurantiacibacter sp. MUD61]|uniref:hypothetical protein n=1 Tax=Aurantiacibacter sp. MUD61 TaxID=3009083 RepID=UPI0022EFDE63|nr:hypothetical protein [Aurantiacibacter sp. MUD61]